MPVLLLWTVDLKKVLIYLILNMSTYLNPREHPPIKNKSLDAEREHADKKGWYFIPPWVGPYTYSIMILKLQINIVKYSIIHLVALNCI